MMLELTGDVRVHDTLDELYDNLARRLMAAAIEAVEERDVFHLALSGGSTPEKFYMHLVIDPRYRNIPWKQTHIWIVDERRVPEDDDRYNFRMIRESLTEHAPFRQRNLHPMPVLHEDPATSYEQQLCEAFGLAEQRPGAEPRIDFTILGMGDDTHTASLFPESKAIDENTRWVAVNDGPAVTPPDRVTMTFPLINASRQIAVLVTGKKKVDALRRVDQQLSSAGPDPRIMPITGIDPGANELNGSLTWYLDVDACGLPSQLPE